jgi:hypothetical protein
MSCHLHVENEENKENPERMADRASPLPVARDIDGESACLFITLHILAAARGDSVGELRYKPKGHGFDSRWSRNLSGRTLNLCRYVGLITLTPS